MYGGKRQSIIEIPEELVISTGTHLVCISKEALKLTLK